MLLERIENNLKIIEKNINKENFIYAFLEAYEQPKATINRLKKGDYNLSKNDNELIWNKKVYYHETSKEKDVHYVIDEISKSEEVKKNKIRFIIVTDFKLFLSIDTKTGETLDIQISKLSKNSNFFLPLTGLEKAENILENLADIKAADKMAKLYDLMIKDNPNLLEDDREKHGLNIFFTRILFCFFSEDTGIFDKSLFTKSIISYTNENGDDLHLFLKKLFEILNSDTRKDCPEYLNLFPYVNGGLFKNNYSIPKFSKESRKILIESGELNWNSINPDILGSMMQAIVQQGIRQELGMHYTSVKNILKIIKPLFLDNLYEELFIAGKDEKKLRKILKKIYNIIIFDPACGSGNFLVIAYKELYKIEIEILKELREVDRNDWLIVKSGIELSQFFGIELDDYAHESAKLSLWIAQHQMNVLYKEILNEERPTLPLTPSGNIFCGNATSIEWEKICPKDIDKKIYLIGNPPYVGSSMQNKVQKDDMNNVFKDNTGYKNLDYISCWFVKGSKFIRNANAEMAFISTKSICQGEQVSMLWPIIFNLDLEIGFCYESFKWSNNAKYNAGVTCVVISIRNISNKDKKIFEEISFRKVKNINPYLTQGRNIFIEKKNNSISNLPKMSYGNKPVDGGNLILSLEEKNELINKYPLSKKMIKNFYGADEFIKGNIRFCLWIENKDLDLIKSIPPILKKIEKIKIFRNNSKKPATKRLALRSHQFEDLNISKNNSIIIPSVSSEKRRYIPIGFLDKNVVVSNAAHVIFDPPLYLLAILCSYMHMKWVFTVGGYLGSSIRYSSTLCYNSYPFPEIDNKQKKNLEEASLMLIDEREKYPDKTMAELYDREKMPRNLYKTHQEIDGIVDNIYQSKPFRSDEERLEHLFNLYEKIRNKDILI